MITIPRALARVLRAVLRRSVVEEEPKGEWPLLLCRGGPDGLALEAHRASVGVRYQLDGPQPAGVLTFRSTILAEFEGRGNDPVTLEPTGPGKARARWQESGVPRVLDLETVDPETIPPLPAQPARWAALPDSFPQVLLDAANTTARESGRFTLTRVQLRGSRGQVAATDGRQLLIRNGFDFPWKEDVLIPRLPALGLRELRDERLIGIRRTEEHVVLRIGAWTFFLAIDRTSRFPDVQSVVPRPSTFTSRLRLAPEDVAFLAKSLPGLPGADDDHSPVTLDLGERAVLRARGEGEAPSTELELARSIVEGKAVRISANRLYLRRALALGFRELQVGAPGQPAAWRGGDDVYLFVPLDAGSTIPPSQDAVRVTSAPGVPRPISDHRPDPEPERSEHTMPEPNGNSHATNGPQDHAAGIEELIDETEGLKRALQEAATRAGRLAAALRQQRRQSRAVQAAVEALRGLKIGR
ncbi:MAG: hypothetical protein IT429_02045 [Gemmataceae bacterium]|nr:hypothetical protein [Gemmataceae bacterium]